jgi:hypothetical protein
MKNKNTYWIVGGILLVVVIIAIVYAVTRKKPTPVTTVPVNTNPGGISGLIGGISNIVGMFGGGGNSGSINSSEVENATIG